MFEKASNVVSLRPDRYLPLKFELPPPQQREAFTDYQMATIVLEFAQQARNTVYQTGEPLSDAKRQAIMAMVYIAQDCKP